MNERIKELKKQAWEYTMAVHDGHIVPPLDKEVWPIDKVLDEKFAELLVAECADLVKARLNHIPDNQDDWDGHNYGETAAVYGILDTFQEHFGVDCDPKNSKFGVEEKTVCHHDWYSAKNPVVLNGSVCVICGAIDPREPEELNNERTN